MAFYHDVKSGIKILEHLAANTHGAGTYAGTAVDIQGQGIRDMAFLISGGSISAGATLDAKVQWSDDNSAWTDEAGPSNDTAMTQMTAAGRARLNVPVATHRYYRVMTTVGGTTPTVIHSVTAVLGGTRHLPVAYATGE